MRPDAATQAFLDRANASAPPPLEELTIAEIRQAVEAFRPHGLPREDVRAVEDVSLSSSSIRIYTPDAPGEPLPVIVWAHGGSWVRVTVDLLDTMFRAVANRSGCVVVAPEYRLAPEHPFPAALEDVYETACWVAANAAERGYDRQRIAIAGESAGATLAAAAALLDRDRHGAGFALQALVVPLLDLTLDSPSWDELGDGYLLTRDQVRWALRQYAPDVDAVDPRVAPLAAADLDGLPPAVVVTGGLDPLRDDGERF